MIANTMKLACGAEVPLVGLGLWKISNDDAPRIVEQAIADGYRHLDSACDYGNEPAVGAGWPTCLQAGKVRREQLWVTSKLWNTYHAPQHVRPAAERSLRDLGLDYLDLYLIHFPIAQAFVPFDERYPPGWFADPKHPEQGHQPGRRAIVGNMGGDGRTCLRRIGAAYRRQQFWCFAVARFVFVCHDPPGSVASRAASVLAQEKLLRFCREEQIGVTGFSPLGGGSYVPLGMAKADDSVLEQPAVRQIAANHRTPAQIVLRWGVQRGTAVIPKTSRPERLRENLAIFDFELTPDEMQSSRRSIAISVTTTLASFAKPRFTRFIRSTSRARACERMGTGSEHGGGNPRKKQCREVPVPILSPPRRPNLFWSETICISISQMVYLSLCKRLSRAVSCLALGRLIGLVSALPTTRCRR